MSTVASPRVSSRRLSLSLGICRESRCPTSVSVAHSFVIFATVRALTLPVRPETNQVSNFPPSAPSLPSSSSSLPFSSFSSLSFSTVFFLSSSSFSVSFFFLLLYLFSYSFSFFFFHHLYVFISSIPP